MSRGALAFFIAILAELLYSRMASGFTYFSRASDKHEQGFFSVFHRDSR